MSLTSSGIDNVRSFELPAGIWADGGYAGSPRVALVKWRSCWTDMIHQVYINGRFAGATIDTEQRQLVIQLPGCSQSAARIEIFAVAPEYAHIDFSGHLDSSFCGTGRVKILMVRHQNLTPGSVADVHSDNGTGQIDYSKALNDPPIRVWPAWQDKAGFGMSRFGASDFGYDSAAAVGFGKGSFGQGGFGLDADTFEWTSPPMPAGVYKFAVQITSPTGTKSSIAESRSVTLVPPAKPAHRLSVSTFDKETNQLVLNVS
jgi:hypothetical protein